MRRMKAGRTRSPARRHVYRARRRAYLAGRKAAGIRPPTGSRELSIAMLNRLWNEYRRSRLSRIVSWRSYFLESRSFIRGYSRAAGSKPQNWVLVPTNKSIAAVVTAMNEAGTLGRLMKQLSRLPFAETVVVVNGSSDNSFSVARGAGATVVYDPDPLGHDVGRAMGAKMVKSDIVLFLDGDIPIEAERLVPFLYAIHCGSDVALNNIKPFLAPMRNWDHVTLMKEFLNRCLDRPDLSANSLTAVPHALSAKALAAIGASSLMVPPKAHTIAIQRGLKVTAPSSVDVITLNKSRMHNVGITNPVSELIVGDHFEALQLLRKYKGTRMGFADIVRKRKTPREKCTTWN